MTTKAQDRQRQALYKKAYGVESCLRNLGFDNCMCYVRKTPSKSESHLNYTFTYVCESNAAPGTRFETMVQGKFSEVSKALDSLSTTLANLQLLRSYERYATREELI